MLYINNGNNIVNKLIYEPTVVCSSIYPELKVKYISQLEPKIEKIKSIKGISVPYSLSLLNLSKNKIKIKNIKIFVI